MTSLHCSRRTGLALGAALAASTLVPLRTAMAQAVATQRDWLGMVRQHHDLLERAFEELMAPNNASYEQASLQVRNLDQLLTAHSMAEENLIYPAMARSGMLSEAERLYMEEAHMKILKAQVELMVAAGQAGGDWREPAGKLRAMLLEHARKDEEQRLFPQLQQKLSPQENRRLSVYYPREFARVLPVVP